MIQFSKILWIAAVLAVGCQKQEVKAVSATEEVPEKPVVETIDSSKIFKGEKVPVLCYHAIREIEKGDSPDQKAYSVSPANFALQMKTLADSGYATITPDQLLEYHTARKPLPQKPVMITFDDGRKEQFTIAAREMEDRGFRGTFFIMTVALGKKRYMSRDDVRALADKGHTIGSHTWDHQMVTKLEGEAWGQQIAKPKKQLEEITGKPVTSFAYPFGVWNAAAADSLKSNGFKTAFIFYGKQDPDRPHFTFERINGPNISDMEKFMKRVKG